MFGPRGNPQARDLFAVISHLQRQAGLTLHVAGARGGSGPWRSSTRAIFSSGGGAGRQLVCRTAQALIEEERQKGHRVLATRLVKSLRTSGFP